MLYHGTIISGQNTIKAISKSHSTGKSVAYFTEDRCCALICCRSKTENFVTMGVRADGKQHYFERFPNQLEILYKEKQGYVYLLESSDGVTHMKGHTRESEYDVPVVQCEVVMDIYDEILREESQGNIVIHRYSEIDQSEQKRITLKIIFWMKGRKWRNFTILTFPPYGIRKLPVCRTDTGAHFYTG